MQLFKLSMPLPLTMSNCGPAQELPRPHLSEGVPAPQHCLIFKQKGAFCAISAGAQFGKHWRTTIN